MRFQKPTPNLGMDYSQNITIDSQSSDSRMFHEVIISKCKARLLIPKKNHEYVIKSSSKHKTRSQQFAYMSGNYLLHVQSMHSMKIPSSAASRKTLGRLLLHESQ